ncbi:MAG: beta-galactosidase, partial [Betaproteobacteria bacterium]
MPSLRLSTQPAIVERDFLALGDGGAGPSGTLAVNSRFVERDGRPWMPVMGEFHYSRCPQAEWADELRRMRAGGIDIVASYAFWNHHEADEGRFDWSGLRDLRRFVQLAHEAGLMFYLRPGPWVHAESRNGGLPDWLQARGDDGSIALRSNDARYLDPVRRFFGEIGRQLGGLLWSDGGPLVGAQLENEYDGRGPGRGAELIAELKRIALESGLRVPLWTVTGWPTLDIPPREVLPVSGAYPDGFWGGSTGPQPPSGVFAFNTGRSIGEMGNVGG